MYLIRYPFRTTINLHRKVYRGNSGLLLLGACLKHIQNIVMVPKNVSNAVINLVYGPQQKLRKKTDLGPSSVQHRVSWSGLSIAYVGETL